MSRPLAVALSLPLVALAAGSAPQAGRGPHAGHRAERPTLRRPVAPVSPAVAADLELSAECSARRPGVTRLVARWSRDRADGRGARRWRARDQRLDVTVHKGGFERGLAATLWPVRQGRHLRPLRPTELPPRFFRSALALRARSLGSEDGRLRLELEAPETGLNYFVRVLELEAGEWVPGPTRHVGIPPCISEEPEEGERSRRGRRTRRTGDPPRRASGAVRAIESDLDLRTATGAQLTHIDFGFFQYSTVSTSIAEINPDATVGDPASTGGRINRLASDAAGSRWFAASEWGGLYRSTDGGVHWDRLDDHRPQATWDVAVDPLDPMKVYATSFFDGRVSSRAGINVSTDGGDTWQRPATATPPEGFCDPTRAAQPSAFGIAIDPDDPQNVWIGTNCGVALSVDAGTSWSFIDPTPDDPPDGVWDVAVHNGLVDTFGFDGQLRSADGGATWQGPSGFAVPSGTAGQIEVSPDEDHVLYAAMGIRLWESVDGGASWSPIDPPGKNQGRVPFVRLNDRAGPDYDLWYGDVTLVRTSCTTPANPAPGGPSRCSYQPGAWDTDLHAGAHVDVGDVAFDPTAGSDACPVLYANDGGVHRNADLGPGCQSPAWENPARSPHALWLFALKASTFANAQESFETLLMGTQDNRALVSFDSDAPSPSWTARLGGDVFDIVPRQGGMVAARCCRTGGAQLLLTTTTLGSAVEIADYPPGDAPGFAYGDIVDRIGSSGHVMATSQGVWLTSDIAQSPVQWTALGPSSFPVSSVPFRKIKVRGSGAKTRIYLQLGGNYGHTADEVWRYDGAGPGGTWEPVLPPGGTGGFSVFEASHADPDRIVAGHLDPVQGPAMVRSGDGGATWEPLPGLDALMTASGAVLYQNQHGPAKLEVHTGYPQPTFVQFVTLSTVLAGAADSGLFVSADAGESWEPVRNPLFVLNPTPHLTRPRVADQRFRFDTSLTDHYYFYVGTRGRGVFRIAASVPRGPILDVCELFPRICFPIERVPPFQFVLRPRTPRDVFAGTLGDHCPAEGCPALPGRDAPAFVSLFLDGLSPEAWEVRLYEPEGAVAAHGVYRTRTGTVLSFRPDADTWRRFGLARYGLGLTALPERDTGTTAFTSRLVVSDAPFVPESLDDVVF